MQFKKGYKKWKGILVEINLCTPNVKCSIQE